MYKWIAVILVLLGIDQTSKLWIAATYPENDPVPLIKGFLNITYTRNSGFVFGISQGTAAEYYYIFVIVFLLAVGIFGYMFVKNDFSDKRTFLYALSLSLLIAGAMGNTIDRIFQSDHNVIDFIDFFTIWNAKFNFADTWMNIGIVLFMIDLFFLEPKRVKVQNG